MPGSVVTPSERLDLERMQQLMLMGVQTEEDEEEYSEFLFLNWALVEEQRQSDAHPDRFLDWRRLIDEHTAARIVDCRMLTRFDPSQLRRIAKAIWGDELFNIHEDPSFGSCHGCCCCSPPVSHSPVLPVSHHRTWSQVLSVDKPLWAASRRVGPRHDPGQRRSDV